MDHCTSQFDCQAESHCKLCEVHWFIIHVRLHEIMHFSFKCGIGWVRTHVPFPSIKNVITKQHRRLKCYNHLITVYATKVHVAGRCSGLGSIRRNLSEYTPTVNARRGPDLLMNNTHCTI